MVVAVPALGLNIPSTPKRQEKPLWQQNRVMGHKGCLLPAELVSGGSWGTSTLLLSCHGWGRRVWVYIAISQHLCLWEQRLAGRTGWESCGSCWVCCEMWDEDEEWDMKKLWDEETSTGPWRRTRKDQSDPCKIWKALCATVLDDLM